MSDNSQQQGGQQQGQEQQGQQQGTGKEFLQFFPEKIRGEKTLEKFSGKDQAEVLGKLAESYINLEKMPRGIVPPKDDAKPEEWDAFFEKLGRPKTVDEYGVKAKVPEGLEWNKQAEKLMLSHMHKRGLTKAQAQGLLDDYLALSAESLTKVRQERAHGKDAAEAAMRERWGGLADRNIALVQRTVHEFGGDEFKTYLDETGLGNDPRFFEFVHKLATPLMEDNIIRGENLGMKRDDAKAELDARMKHESYAKVDHPEHKATMERIRSLYPIAHAS